MNAQCLNDVGTPQCVAPYAPSAPPPGPPAGTRVVLQTGQPLRLANGSLITYNSTTDAAITTQYQASWNQNREHTHTHKHIPTHTTRQVLA